MSGGASQQGQGSPNNDRNTSVESGVPEIAGLRPLAQPEPGYGSTKAEPPTNCDSSANDTWWLAFFAKAMYFSRFAQQGVFYSYLAVFLVQWGFSVSICGIFFAIIFLAQSFGSSMLPLLTDALLIPTSVGVVSHLVGSLVMVLLVQVQGPQFIQFAIILGLGNFLVGGTGVLVDAAVFQLVRTRGLNFGRQRLWGCIGWGLGSFIASQFISAYGIAAMWSVYALLTPFTTIAIALLLSSVSRPQPPRDSKASWSVSEASSIFEHSGDFLLHPLVPPFLLSMFAKGILFAASSPLYMSVWVIVDLHANYAVLGVAAMVLSACEIPMFFYSAAAGKQVGVHGALYIAALTYGAWLLCYGCVIYNPWWIVPVQPLHAVAFAFPIGLVGALTTKLAEEVGLQNSTAQGFKQGALNAGRTVGYLVAGWLFQAYSATLMFRVAAFSSVLMLFAAVKLHVAARGEGKCELLY